MKWYLIIDVMKTYVLYLNGTATDTFDVSVSSYPHHTYCCEHHCINVLVNVYFILQLARIYILVSAGDLCEHQWDVWEIMLERFAAGAVVMIKVIYQQLLIFYSLACLLLYSIIVAFLHSGLAKAPTFCSFSVIL